MCFAVCVFVIHGLASLFSPPFLAKFRVKEYNFFGGLDVLKGFSAVVDVHLLFSVSLCVFFLSFSFLVSFHNRRDWTLILRSRNSLSLLFSFMQCFLFVWSFFYILSKENGMMNYFFPPQKVIIPIIK